MTRYRVGTHSGVNVWQSRESGDRQVAMARTDHEASQLVQLANAGIALAEATPWVMYHIGDSGHANAMCTLCGAIEGAGDLHLAECGWRMAREALGLDAGWPTGDGAEPVEAANAEALEHWRADQ